MAGFGQFISAVVVAIALIASQMMPAWAGCHSQRHALAKTDIVKKTDIVTMSASSQHGPSHTMPMENVSQSATVDQAQTSTNDMCLGNCGCACGLSGAFLLAAAVAIDAPHGIVLTPAHASARLPLGSTPDGPRRPPRTTA